MRLYYDLHIHSCLSPCGDDDMTPANIAAMAMLKGLDVIAVTDHNTARNVRAVTQASRAIGGATVVPGVELETAENIHLVCLFDTVERAEEFGEYAYARLPDVSNRADIFGAQNICDAEDNTVGTLEKLLINATDLTVSQAVAEVRSRGGVCYPAHVDREANGMLAILGDIPRALAFKTVEFSTNADKELQKRLKLEYNLVYGSDAHYLENIFEREHYYEAEYPSLRGLLRRLDQRTE